MDEGEYERDAAAEAFEGVRGELALLRRAIEGIAARDDRPEPPDYSETLGQITKLATATYQRAEILRKATEEETVARQVAARITLVEQGITRAERYTAVVTLGRGRGGTFGRVLRLFQKVGRLAEFALGQRTSFSPGSCLPLRRQTH